MQNYPSYPQNANANPPNDKQGCLGKSFWGGVGAIAAVATLIVAIISIPQAAAIRQGFSQTFSGTAAQTPTAASTPIPTPAPITITKSLQIPCASCYHQLGLELQSIDININDDTSVFHFKVTNNDGYTDQVIFSQLRIQDDNGNTYNAEGGDIPNLGPGNSEIVIRSFPFALKRGVHYIMSVTLNSGLAIYKDQSITASY